ncbi:MAG: hypothetical protein M1817_001203 [Caeruleum heppii]|nr:MAG: hypothetical protein M1817_001203 [Caeruleum heppii]
MSSNIDDRTLHELYLWPFASSVRAGVGSVMCSYQMVNNSYACANSKLMNGILKDELGFQGFVQSDWLAQRSGVASALAGLDMTMPGDGLRWQNGESLWGSRLTEAALNESIPMSRLNDMAMRIVAAWYQLSQDEWPAPPPDGDGGPNFSSWTDKEVDLLHPGSDDTTKGVVNKFVDAQGTGNGSHGILIRKIAAEGTVLVKNEGQILPLYRLASGWGSGAVDYPYLVTPLEALKKAFDPEKVYLSSHPTNKPPFKATPSILTEQDICMVFINSDGGEGFIASDGIRGDRNDLYSQKGGDKLIQSVAEGCGNGQGSTIVVVHAIGPVILERWVDLKGVKAVILANLPGQESGNALADVLFGDVNPSGKLPYTVGRDLEDYGKGGQVMYYPNEVVPQQDFREGLYIDYRHFDKARLLIYGCLELNIEPRYEFGFGLSYTTFEFTNISLTTTKPKTPYPSPRPATRNPPTLPETLPPLSETIFPAGFRRLKEYIYPYLDKSTVIKKGRYPYPAGYEDVQPPSAAGGGEGGNPSLWDVHGIINVTVKNTGSRGGQEVVQLYVAFPENVPSEEDQSSAAASKVVDFPTKVLRGFDKIELAPGEVRTISLNLTRKDLSYWSIKQGNWVMPTVGTFKVLVGSSSRRLPLTVEL